MYYNRFTVNVWIISACVLFSGCSLHHTRQQSTIQVSTAQAQDTIATDEQSPEAQEALYCVEIGSIIADAKAACSLGMYDKAHMLYSHAVSMIIKTRETDDISIDAVSLDDFLDTIANAYATLMPASYLDIVPDDISLLIVQKQMSRSLDSMDLVSLDSNDNDLTFCQKGITYNYPIVWNNRVHRSLLFFKSGRKGPVARWISRSRYYLPLMQQMFKDSGLPTDLAFLPLIESGYNPRAYSRARAAGIWQFIESTGRSYNLRKNFWIDERMDPIASTQAAIRYLKKLYNEFSDWHLALASYNCGENGVHRSINKNQATDFWQLSLPKETMNYVPEFIAAIMVAKNASCFGFNLDTLTPFNLDTITISESIELKIIAEKTGTSEEEFRRNNPHLLQWCTPPDMGQVLIYLPAGTAGQFREFYTALPDEYKVKWFRYKARSGEKIAAIANRFKVPMAAIKMVNHIKSSRIAFSDYIYIPVSGNYIQNELLEPTHAPEDIQRTTGKFKYRIKPGDTVSELAELFHVSSKDICFWNNLSNVHSMRAGDILIIYAGGSGPLQKQPIVVKPELKKPLGGPGKNTYMVRAGDNLSVIARRLHVPVHSLAIWNNLTGASLLTPGDELDYYVNGAKDVDDPSESNAYIAYRVSNGDNISKLAELFSIDAVTLYTINNLSKDAVLHTGDIINIPRNTNAQKKGVSRHIVYYTVKNGDTLWGIAQKYEVSMEHIVQINNFEKSMQIKPGDTVKIVVSEK